MARVYWVRSLVPIEKKSTCSAKRSAITAAEGTSIMMPISMGGTPSFWRSSSITALAMCSSSKRAIIGNITRALPAVEALRMARN